MRPVLGSEASFAKASEPEGGSPPSFAGLHSPASEGRGSLRRGAVIRGLPGVRVRRPLCLAIGVFDGVHLGHQAIVGTAVKMAGEGGRGAVPAVLTFDPHPDMVLSPHGAPALLTTTDEKIELLRALGIELVIVVEFTRAFADTRAEEFIAEVVGKRLRACCAVVGEGWRFGAGGKGDLRMLRQMAAALGFGVRAVGRVRRAGQLVSSTRVRTLLSHGRVSAAKALLGRPYALSGEVVAGDGRGRALGFPTANLRVAPEKLIPADGVYACLARVKRPGAGGQGCLRPAVASIGVRPTFERAGQRRVEVHLLEGGGVPDAALRGSEATSLGSTSLLGGVIGVQFIARLRGERRFPSAEALARQMEMDCRRAQRALARRGWNRAR